MFQDSQIIQIKKDSDTNFKLNQKIRLYTKTTNFFAMIENLTQDAHFFYLNLDVFIENPEWIKNVLIDKKSIRLGEYIIRSIF